MNLTTDNYFSLEADRAYMSVHQLKAWLQCPAREKARQAGEFVPSGDKPEAFIMGSYVDAALTTPHLFDQHKAEHATELFNAKQKPYAFVQRADEMIARFRRDADAVRLLDGQGQVPMTAELEYTDRKGQVCRTPWKILIDVFHADKGVFVDLKTTQDFEPAWKNVRINGEFKNIRVPWYLEYDYQFQMAVYQQVIAANTGKTPLPIILGVTKQTPPDIGAWTFDDPEWLLAEYLSALAQTPAGFQPHYPEGNDAFGVLDGMEAVLMMKRGEIPATRCESCDWCRGTKKLNVYKATAKL